MASAGSVAFNDVNVQINQRLFLDRNDSTLTLRRPNGQSRVGLNLNTGANRSWSMWIAENDGDTPALRFLQDGQGFSEDEPQFEVRPTGDVSVGRDAHIARNLSVDGALEVGGQPVAKDAPIGAIALHTERANAAMIANGYTPLYMKVSAESESQNGSWRRLADLPIAQEWPLAPRSMVGFTLWVPPQPVFLSMTPRWIDGGNAHAIQRVAAMICLPTPSESIFTSWEARAT